MSSLRRSIKSAKTPPASVRINPGAVAMNPSTPSQNGEFESCRTSQPCATACIHVPVFERNAPDQNSRKFRCRSARNISLRPRLRSDLISSRADISILNNIAPSLAQNFSSSWIVTQFRLFSAPLCEVLRVLRGLTHLQKYSTAEAAEVLAEVSQRISRLGTTSSGDKFVQWHLLML